MKFSEFSVRNSLFVNLLSVFIIVAGLLSLKNLHREAFPPIDFNVVTVSAYFRGASADKVERLLTTPLERELREVDNVEEILSSSDEGMSLIAVKISEEVKDVRGVVNDIQKAVDRVTSLPDDVDDRPIVTEIKSAQIPVIKVSLSGDLDEFSKRDYADSLREKLEEIPGVASVERGGWRDEEYWVESDVKKMKEYHISFTELSRSLGFQNVDIPGGKQEVDGKEFMIKVKAEIRSKEQIENTVIRANDLGNWIYVKDVANVRHTFQDDIVLEKAYGSRAITLVVIKRGSGDIINVTDAVKKILEDFKIQAPSELKIATFFDLSYYVRRRLNVLKNNGFIGFILVVLVLFAFLPPMPAFMTSLGIPIAFFTTFIIMSSFGLTINLLTMFGLIMVLGIIVDDGIIISENIYRHIENGKTPREAAIIGADEVYRPVLATILTTVVAFSPLMMMTGMMGRFVKFIPFVVIIALFASLLEAFFILPSHMADFAHAPRKGHKRKEVWWFSVILFVYKHCLKAALKTRYLVWILTIILFFASLGLAKKHLKFILFPARGIEQFNILLEAAPDTTLEATNGYIESIEEIVSTLPSEYLDAYETIVGQIAEERGYDPGLKRGSNYAQVRVFLTPASDREKTSKEIIAQLQPEIDEVFEKLKKKGVEKVYVKERRGGPPVGSAVDVRVRGEDFSVMKKICNEIKDYLSSIKGVMNITDNYNLGAQEIEVYIDEKKAKRAYLTNAEIAFAIRAAFSGVVATTIKQDKAEKEIKVLVRLPEQDRNSQNVFDEILVANSMGNIIPLRKVVNLEKNRGLRTIKHIDGKRFIAVTADVDEKNINSLRANKMIKERFKDISFNYPGYSLKFSGEQEETQKSMASLLKALIIAVLLIYLILATQFNSLFQPFIVMVTIPFGLIGFIVAFVIHKEPISFLAFMGFIGLTGVVVNDSIVLVDFINKRRKDLPVKEAAFEAGLLRLRPVLLTTITTVFGLATVAYGIGGLDPFLRPMALAMSWGLAFATVLTLIVIPCIYVIAADIKGLLCRKKTCKQPDHF